MRCGVYCHIIPVNLSGPVCSRPDVAEGIEELTLNRVYEVGDQVNLVCERGFLPSTATPRKLTCTDAGGWTPADLACTRESTELLDSHSAVYTIVAMQCLSSNV